MKPILKWPGGKRRLAAKISEAFGEKCRGRYIEPFVGGAAVYLHRFAAGELIGQCYLRDINRRLISTYKNVAKKPEMVHGLVSSLQAQHERAADKKCFYNLV